MTTKEIRFIVPLIILLHFSKLSFGQYLHVDRLTLSSGQVFTGIIIEEHQPDYLILETKDFGPVKIRYSLIEQIIHKPNLEEPFYQKRGHQYLSISIGAGQSYGGLGVRFQHRVGRKFGFAYSVGFGYNEISEYGNNMETTGISIGARGYYKWVHFGMGLLIDFQELMDYQQNLYLMTGYDFAINNKFSINTGIGIYSQNSFILNTGFLAVDIGVMYKFPANQDKEEHRSE